MLSGLPAELQSYGWRLSQRPGADVRRAVGWLSSDVNALADAIGGLTSPVPRLKLPITGPLTLAAGVHLPSGERVLADPGARRDLSHSLAEGVQSHLRSVQAAAPGAVLSVQIDEPEALRVLSGWIPTVSGYRRLPALPETEFRSMWQQLLGALRTAGARELVIHVPPRLLGPAGETGFDAAIVPAEQAEGPLGDELAAWIESGRGLILSVGQVGCVAAQARALWRSWRDVGLSSSQLNLRVCEAPGLAGQSVAQARGALHRVTELAEALTEQVHS